MGRRRYLPARQRARIAAAALAAAGGLYAAPVLALEPAFTLERAQVSGGLRYGSEGLKFGVGARGGYTIDPGIYVGGLFDYWFGDSEETAVPGGGNITAKSSGWDMIGECGYDLGVAPTVVIRPFGGLGIIHGDTEVCTPAGCIDASGSDAIGAFGAQALFWLDDGFHVGAELRVMFSEEAAIVIGGNIGADF
jgi:hypothetical protein